MTAISQIRTPSALSLSDLNTTVNHEPRVLDVLLAERLGMANPRSIREMIEANRAELEGHGGLSAAPTNPGKKGGRPGKAYYLNEGQALVICALSRTANAAAVRHALITVYMEYRRGLLGAPALPPPAVAESQLCAGCFFSPPPAAAPPFPLMAALADMRDWLLNPGVEFRDGAMLPAKTRGEREALIAAGQRLARVIESGGANKLPPFCPGCVAHDRWNNPLWPQGEHPLRDGPLTGPELAIVGQVRDIARSAKAVARKAVVSRMVAELSATIEGDAP